MGTKSTEKKLLLLGIDVQNTPQNWEMLGGLRKKASERPGVDFCIRQAEGGKLVGEVRSLLRGRFPAGSSR